MTIQEKRQRLENFKSGIESAALYATGDVERGNYADIKWLIEELEVAWSQMDLAVGALKYYTRRHWDYCRRNPCDCSLPDDAEEALAKIEAMETNKGEGK